MNDIIPVFTYLQHRVCEKIYARIVSRGDEGITLAFETDLHEYQVYLRKLVIENKKLVLFDGDISPGILWSYSRLLDYEYGEKASLTRQYAVHEFEETTNTEMVKKTEVPAPHFSGYYYERSVPRGSSMTHSRIIRSLLLIPNGESVLGFRVKPRSLARQYTRIEALDSCVVFRTIRS